MRNFYAINLFGIIFTCIEMSEEEKNHELIHTAQAKELLYVPFYLWYVIEWTVLFLKFHDWMKAYHSIRFEKEAYSKQHDLHYLCHRRHFCYLSL